LLNSAPALNFGRFFALIWIGFPVCGLRPVLAFVCCTENVPKPVKVTFSPFLTDWVMVSKIASNVSFTSFWFLPVFLATASTNSFPALTFALQKLCFFLCILIVFNV
jgi:hypothetical protein